MESFTVKLVANASAQLFADNTLIFYLFFNGATESGGSMGGCSLGNITTINVTNCHRGKVYVFDLKKFSETSTFYYREHGLYPSITEIVQALNTLMYGRYNHSENCITFRMNAII